MRNKSVSEHLSVPALKQHADPSESLGSGLPEDLPRVEGEGIPKLACNLVEASESLGYHWNERKTLPVAIVCHPLDLPLVCKSQRVAGLFSFSCNSSVLERVYDSDIEGSIETGVPMQWGMRMSAGLLSTPGSKNLPSFLGFSPAETAVSKRASRMAL